MKKIVRTASVLLATILLSCTVACGGKKIQDFQDSGTLIVTVYDGGYGTDWAKVAANKFNEANPDSKYKIEIRAEKIDISTITSYIESGLNISRGECAYFMGMANADASIRRGVFTDLSDVLEMTSDNGVKIKDKIQDFDIWKRALSDDKGNGCYALPYDDSIIGFIFNYDLFLQKGWLKEANPKDSSVLAELTRQGVTYSVESNNLIFKSYSGNYKYFNLKEGDVITDCGRDGIYGSYDDGQPNSIAEWDEMVNNIKADTTIPFIFSGTYSYSYATSAFRSILCDVEGVENYEMFYSMDSKGKEVELKDSSKVVITPENGYQVYNMKGFEEGLDFLYKYMNVDTGRDNNYLHPAAYLESGYSHKQAQSSWLYSQAMGGTTDNPKSAMLYDGTWWENEARPQFTNLVKAGFNDYEYGVQDFRFMMYPHYTKDATKSTFTSYGNCGIFVPSKVSKDATENEEIIKHIKKFIAYTCSDEVLQDFTVETGVVRPYVYDIPSDKFAKMSKFAQSFWAMYSDTENVVISRPQVLWLNRPLKLKTSNYMEYPFNLPNNSGNGTENFLGLINALQGTKTNGTVVPYIANNVIETVKNGWTYFK